jgi:hypothetical protein
VPTVATAVSASVPGRSRRAGENVDAGVAEGRVPAPLSPAKPRRWMMPLPVKV